MFPLASSAIANTWGCNPPAMLGSAEGSTVPWAVTRAGQRPEKRGVEHGLGSRQKMGDRCGPRKGSRSLGSGRAQGKRPRGQTGNFFDHKTIGVNESAADPLGSAKSPA